MRSLRRSTSLVDWQWHCDSPTDSAPDFETLESPSLELLELARSARDGAYAPYSGFRVGSAVRALDSLDREETFTGANVENASYGATMCAERVAMFAAVSHGFNRFAMIALSTQSATGGTDHSERSPCGLCRQVMAEFATGKTRILIDGGEDDQGRPRIDLTDIDTLLPWKFRL